MKNNIYIVHSEEALVFRDGRPFGNDAQVHGGLLRWPHPCTVLGMFRSRIGLSRDMDFFVGEKSKQNIEQIKKIGMLRMIPMWQLERGEDWQPLFPAPADVIITEAKKQSGHKSFSLHPLHYESPRNGEGVNLPWSNWLLPISKVREKPAKNAPDLWYQKPFEQWLEDGSFPQPLTDKELGTDWPVEELRLHTAVNNDTGTVLEGQLFSSRGIRLGRKSGEDQLPGRYGIGVELTGMREDDHPEGSYFLGGDRKIAHIESAAELFPPCPPFTPSRYLRLILVTAGNFASWAPSWLHPDDGGRETAWKRLPGSDIDLRLVSASLPRWQAVSGWDMETRGPKATARLVPAGSVYLIELKNPQQAPELAAKLWGKNLAMTETADGYGCVCIGKQSIEGE
ncbi:MAG: hypothetical protein M0O96_05730 [Desulforhopalus sp.]|nr:hypothetical protein [Desulforhopalus sp.]